MTAMYEGKRVNIFKVSSDKKYVLASYAETKTAMFKIDVTELSEKSVMLQAELNKESF